MPAKALRGLRVLVPRGGKWGDSTAAVLRGEGAIPVIAPMINFASADDSVVLANSLHELQDGQFDWIVITSATTVDVLVGLGVIIPDSTKVVAVGETTGVALALANYRVDFAPIDNSARGLVAQWRESKVTGRVLVPQSDIPEPTLVSGLAELDLDVQFLAVYRTVGVPVSEAVRSDVASGRIGAILVSSGSVARQIADQLTPLPTTTVVACIGPRTAFDARAAGITVDVIAEIRSSDSLVAALVEHVGSLREPTD
ncbi:MAG: uroporphyrinogen-III synthase [Rhodoglobus sp.]|nr:uroporphyrinogen-III synthase [Rhodoglobus sp.]